MIGPAMGSAIAPTIVVLVGIALGWRYSFLVLSLMSALIGFALIFTIRKEIRREVKQVEKPKFSIPRNVIGLSFMSFITLLAFFGMLTFFPDFLVNEGRNIKEASFYFSLLSVVGIFGSMVGGIVYDKVGGKSLFTVLFFNALLSFLLVKTPCLLLVLLLGLFFYSVNPIIIAYASDYATSRNLSTVIGFVNMISIFGATIGPYFMGSLIDRAGYKNAFYSIPAMYLLSLLVLILEEHLKFSQSLNNE